MVGFKGKRMLASINHIYSMNLAREPSAAIKLHYNTANAKLAHSSRQKFHANCRSKSS